MKVELRNKNTGEKHLCEKVTIDKGDFYYVDKVVPFEELVFGRWYYSEKENDYNMFQSGQPKENYTDWKEIIATNASAIKLPQVIYDIEVFANEYCKEQDRVGEYHDYYSYKEGYNKHAETHPYSEDDMIEFAEWNELSGWHFNGTTKNWWSDIYPALFPTTKELLQLWKSKQPKVIYFI